MATSTFDDSPEDRWHWWCRALPPVRRFSPAHDRQGRFSFYALPRNPRRPTAYKYGLRHGTHGVRDARLLSIYKEALESAYDAFVLQGRPEPTAVMKGKDGRVPVYVFAVDDGEFDCGAPCMDEILFVEEGGQPRLVGVLALPSRFSEPDPIVESAQARATAVHELSHLFNARFLPYRRVGPNGLEPADRLRPWLKQWIRSWLWLDEGMAMAAEAEVLPGNVDWLGCTLDWVDRPEQALDDWRSRYQSALFVRYINRMMAGRGDPGFLNRVWPMSASVWDPSIGTDGQDRRHTALSALTEALRQPPHGTEFCSADPLSSDLFASHFCFDSYFLHQTNTPGSEPLVSARFKERAVTRSWQLDRDENAADEEFPYPLQGLGCRYFRFFPGPNAKRLTVHVAAKKGHHLKAELALAEPATGFYVADSRRVGRRRIEGTREIIDCELPEFSRQSCDHAVLVVTNCASGREQPSELPFFTSSIVCEFTVEAVCQ